jgi:hypothetical protein
MNELMMQALLEQPEGLRLTLTEMRAQLASLSLAYSKFKRIPFIGSGDLYFAPPSFRACGPQVLSISSTAQSSLASTVDAKLVLPFESRSCGTPHTSDYASTLMAVASVIEACAQKHISALNTLADSVIQMFSEMERSRVEIAREIALPTAVVALTEPASVEPAASSFWFRRWRRR